MITDTQMLYLYVETPLHAGVGSGLSSIDLPIQRARTTQYPMVQGSGIKGKLRSVAEDMVERKAGTLTGEKVTIMFGPKMTGADHAGALIAGDARVLLFPVRSLSGVFAYTTCYDVLSRFKRDKEHSGASLWDVPAPIRDETSKTPIALVTSANEISASGAVVLEEFSFQARTSTAADEIADWIARNAFPKGYNYWHDKLRRSLVILPDNDFRDFVLYATEIITRIRIDREKKTVDTGALWTEEHLPIDTLLYVPVYATNSRRNGSAMQAKDILQRAAS